MKRGFANLGDESPPETQLMKFSKNSNNLRRIVSFQPNESDTINSLSAKFKSHQSTPYPNKAKLKQLPDTNEDSEITSSSPDKTIEVPEKRHPEFLNKLGSLNRSFIRWIDIYFNKGYNYDFTPVCNDYIRFINNLKERYPIENGGTVNCSFLSNDKFIESESSPIKCVRDRVNLHSQQFLNTPPPAPGDKDYKSTPYPKYLINSNKQESQITIDKLISDKTSKSSTATDKLIFDKNSESSTTTNKFGFPIQPNFTAATTAITDRYLINEEKKETNCSSSFPSTANLPNDFFKVATTNQQTNSISKNLFDIKPNSSNILTPGKDVSNSIKSIDNNFFSPENIFKAQLSSTGLSKSTEQETQQQLNNNSPVEFPNTNITSNTANDDDENYVPPKPEMVCVEEDAIYSVKCKLFLKKDDSYVEKGVGVLHIKETNDEANNQLLIRGQNSLGTIMLNIRLKTSLPVNPTKNGIILTCIPNPPIEGRGKDETASFYIKVKSNDVAKELISYIKKYSK